MNRFDTVAGALRRRLRRSERDGERVVELSAHRRGDPSRSARDVELVGDLGRELASHGAFDLGTDVRQVKLQDLVAGSRR